MAHNKTEKNPLDAAAEKKQNKKPEFVREEISPQAREAQSAIRKFTQGLEVKVNVLSVILKDLKTLNQDVVTMSSEYNGTRFKHYQLKETVAALIAESDARVNAAMSPLDKLQEELTQQAVKHSEQRVRMEAKERELDRKLQEAQAAIMNAKTAESVAKV